MKKNRTLTLSLSLNMNMNMNKNKNKNKNSDTALARVFADELSELRTRYAAPIATLRLERPISISYLCNNKSGIIRKPEEIILNIESEVERLRSEIMSILHCSIPYNIRISNMLDSSFMHLEGQGEYGRMVSKFENDAQSYPNESHIFGPSLYEGTLEREGQLVHCPSPARCVSVSARGIKGEYLRRRSRIDNLLGDYNQEILVLLYLYTKEKKLNSVCSDNNYGTNDEFFKIMLEEWTRIRSAAFDILHNCIMYHVWELDERKYFTKGLNKLTKNPHTDLFVANGEGDPVVGYWKNKDADMYGPYVAPKKDPYLESGAELVRDQYDVRYLSSDGLFPYLSFEESAQRAGQCIGSLENQILESFDTLLEALRNG